MNTSYITAPIIGAIIGYSTNWIAIKMMFRPRKAIKIGKFTLPFTPGIIPKNRVNIARAISSAISQHLLTEEDLAKTLLSEEMKEKITISINSFITDDDKSIGENISEILGSNQLDMISIKASDKISKKIYNTIIEKEVGNIISGQIKLAVEEKVSGSIFNIFGGNKILKPIMENMEEKINDYIVSDGEALIREMVDKEINECLNKNFSELIVPNEETNKIILNIYEKFVINKLSTILSKVNIEKIIENKINKMDIIELENLILKVMKKELNAIVNLGALIGLLLGLLNILF